MRVSSKVERPTAAARVPRRFSHSAAARPKALRAELRSAAARRSWYGSAREVACALRPAQQRLPLGDRYLDPFANDWLVWEPGPWKVPKGSAAGAETLPPTKGEPVKP